MTIPSIRKLLTLMAGAIFTFSCIGNQIEHGFEELPLSYVVVLTTVILSYFGKDALRNVKLKNIDYDTKTDS